MLKHRPPVIPPHDSAICFDTFGHCRYLVRKELSRFDSSSQLFLHIQVNSVKAPSLIMAWALS